MRELLDAFLHADRYLLTLVATYGNWIYGLLFLVIFVETGVVIWPFLPGDSLLFAAGAIAAASTLDIRILFVLLTAAAIIGDAVNYSIGRAIGTRVIHASELSPRVRRLINPEHVQRAHEFFERHGGKAIVLARFVPIVRTFVPFVAGAAAMSYPAFLIYNLTGAAGWVGLCLGAGYLFGNVPIVKDNFSLVALGIVGVSLLPMVFEYVRHRRAASSEGTQRTQRTQR